MLSTLWDQNNPLWKFLAASLNDNYSIFYKMFIDDMIAVMEGSEDSAKN